MIRRISKEDNDRLVGCWNDSAPFDRVSEDLFHEKVAEDEGFRPQFGLLDDEDGHVRGFVIGVARAGGTGAGETSAEGFLKFLAVRPDNRGHGIGSSLLANAEAALRAFGVERIRLGESAPNYLTPGIDIRSESSIRFFEKRGYSVTGEAYNLEARLYDEEGRICFNLDALIREHGERGIEVRRAGRGDEEAVNILLAAHWPSWRDEVARTIKNNPISLHIAVRDKAIIAFSAYDGNNIGTGWFGPMGTDPLFRGQGLGGVLLKRCLSDIADQGHRRVIIPWVEPVGFYHRAVKATIARVFVRMRKDNFSI